MTDARRAATNGQVKIRPGDQQWLCIGQQRPGDSGNADQSDGGAATTIRRRRPATGYAVGRVAACCSGSHPWGRSSQTALTWPPAHSENRGAATDWHHQIRRFDRAATASGDSQPSFAFLHDVTVGEAVPWHFHGLRDSDRRSTSHSSSTRRLQARHHRFRPDGACKA